MYSVHTKIDALSLCVLFFYTVYSIHTLIILSGCDGGDGDSAVGTVVAYDDNNL